MLCTLDFSRVGCVCLKCFLLGENSVALYGGDKPLELLESSLAQKPKFKSELCE